ncbi:uncharacterized protein LOC7476711 isoform X5 [Populus trichocarpa]|uniref:uncharacterized protein LOC7476711 isoform X5 n=1 Tax=Populus trichocarpa TaxID=3694 RepID=UPI002279A965|nr:uncharacterized protein LOC7476711 isoform X5 [Populus trichocarpa]
MGTPPYLMKRVYEAASKGDWDSMKTAYKGTDDKYMMSPITVLKDTAFHLAVYSKKDEPLQSLLRIVSGNSIPGNPCTLQNAYGNTVLHEAVFTGNMKAVELLLQFTPKEQCEYDPSKQLETKNELGETPLYRAASCGKKEIVEYLVIKMKQIYKGKLLEEHRRREKLDKEKNNNSEKVDLKPILHAAIEGQHFETALTLLKRDPSLDDMTDEQGRTCLHLLAEMPSAFKSGRAMLKYSIRNLIYCCLSASNGDDDQSKSKKGYKVLNFKVELHGNNISEEIQYGANYISYIDIFFICKQVVNDDFKEFQIRDGQDNKVFDDASTLKMLSLHEHQNQIVLVVDTAPKSRPQYYSSEPHKGWQAVKIKKEKDKHESALKLAKELIEKNKRHWWQSINVADSNRVNIETPGKGGRGQGVDPNPLFIAISNGIEEIAKEILEKFPQGVELVNETGQNIMHVAVMHRQLEIYNYVKKKFKPIMVRLCSRIDNNGYTLLHQVAHMKHYRGGTKPSPALKLQEEIQWFKRVQRAVPPYLSEKRAPREDPPDNEHKVTAHNFFLQMELEDHLRVVVPPDNEYKLTAHKFLQMEPEDHLRVVVLPYKAMQRDKDCKLTALELFQEEHKAQLKLAQEWIEKTSQSCSAVAVLLATVVFAAAYTIPGGSNDLGFPIFLHNRFFLAFTVLDVIALASSLTSVVMFLSILTSPFEYENFYHNIPRKLIWGFTLLFLSVMTTMLAFACTLFLIIHFRKKWTTGLISFAAFFPVTVFALMQFPLYVSFLSTTKDLFKEVGKYLPRYCCPFRCQRCRKMRRIFCLAY